MDEIEHSLMKKNGPAERMNPSVNEGLAEHRCSCGRLLGRFSGKAEVKCPKCGKMNVIGVEKYET